MLDQEKCWQAVQQKDSNKDGRFFFGVLTTGSILQAVVRGAAASSKERAVF
jgi:methylphosphotriester-DNA--protein-cysteine methyltransferase